MYTPPHARDVHKKDPGRGRMGEPEPTGAFIVMVALAEVPCNAEVAQREGRVA
jgi:hypothetical protein